MTTQNSLFSQKTSTGAKMPTVPSQQAAAAVMVLAAMGATEAKILGRAAMPQNDVVIRGWTFRPAHLDDCDLPAVAWQRLIALHQAGVRPVGYVIAHEPEPDKQQLLLGPAREQASTGWRNAKSQMVRVRAEAGPMARRTVEEAKAVAEAAKPVAAKMAQGLKSFVSAAAPVAMSVGEATAKTAVATAMVLGTVALVTVGAMAYAVALDPIMFALLPADDGGEPVWIEIARWFDEEE